MTLEILVFTFIGIFTFSSLAFEEPKPKDWSQLDSQDNRSLRGDWYIYLPPSADDRTSRWIEYCYG